MAMTNEIRWKQRFSNFKKAGAQLMEFVELGELSKFERQGLIQCFEYTFELAWKTLKDYLELQGFDVNSPRNTIQTAYQAKLIRDGHVWIDALQKRNLMAHTYSESRALEAEALILQKYYPAIRELIATLEGLE
jgi:nucleotidyltransferase substrate binding protein (TIGR01987 family)